MGNVIDTPPEKPRLLIVGYGRHGKDYVAECLSIITLLRYGGSTSWAALPDMAEHLGQHPQVAWERRLQHRKAWYDHCNRLREKDPLLLVRRVLACADMAVGIRDKVEVRACRDSGWFHRIIWVDASQRLGPQKDSTVTFGPGDCDEVLDNNGDKEDLWFKLWAESHRWGLPFRHSLWETTKEALREAGI